MTNPMQTKSRFWLYASGAALLLLVLGAVALWKSNNFVSIESIDAYVCSGTIDGEPLLAELNFAKRPCRTGLVVFPDGTQMLIPGHRVEGEEHVWDIVDDNCQLKGGLRGRWDSTHGTFNGLICSTAMRDSRPRNVTLKRVAQVVQMRDVSGFRIWTFGERRVIDSTIPRFDPTSRFVSVSNEWLGVDWTFDWERALPSVEKLFTKSDDGEEYYRLNYSLTVYDPEILSTMTTAIGVGVTPGQSSNLQSWVIKNDHVENVRLDDALHESVEVSSGGSRAKLSFRDVVVARSRANGFEFPIEKWAEGELRPVISSFAFERAGMRFRTEWPKPGEIVIPWSDLQPLIKPDGPAARYLKK